MKALRLKSWKSEPVLEDVAVPEPGPGEVLVQVGAAGACHSDLHLMHEFEAGVLPWSPPFTLGHENAGWVHALGAGVERPRARRAGRRRRAPGAAAPASTAWTGSRPTATVPTWHRCPAAAAVSASTAGWRSTCSCRLPATWCRSPTASTRSRPRR